MNATKRKIVYAMALILALVTAVLVVFGLITQEQVESVLTLTASFFAAFGSILALIHITPDE